MAVLAVVQHHPSRAQLLGRLVDQLEREGLDGLVVTDREDGRPSPWRGYQACIAAGAESDAEHVLVVQDDAILCFDFGCWLDCRIAAEPDATLVLFLAAQPRLTANAAKAARGAGEPFAPLDRRDYMPAVAVTYPAATLRQLHNWCGSYTGRHTRSDDYMLGVWQRTARPQVLVTVPSLIQHPDDTPSLIGNGNGSHGRNPARVALHWDG